MKKYLTLSALVIAVLLGSYGYSVDMKAYRFNGAWLPSVSALDVGPENYTSLINMEYTDTGMVGVRGYTKINTTAISGNSASLNGRGLSRSKEAS